MQHAISISTPSDTRESEIMWHVACGRLGLLVCVFGPTCLGVMLLSVRHPLRIPTRCAQQDPAVATQALHANAATVPLPSRWHSTGGREVTDSRPRPRHIPTGRSHPAASALPRTSRFALHKTSASVCCACARSRARKLAAPLFHGPLIHDQHMTSAFVGTVPGIAVCVPASRCVIPPEPARPPRWDGITHFQSVTRNPKSKGRQNDNQSGYRPRGRHLCTGYGTCYEEWVRPVARRLRKGLLVGPS
jgi:hypothetical protein